jgi:hypothetical protein
VSDLDAQMAKAGADLQVFEVEESEKMNRRASLYGYGITVLYLLGLLLTVFRGVYEIAVPGGVSINQQNPPESPTSKILYQCQPIEKG